MPAVSWFLLPPGGKNQLMPKVGGEKPVKTYKIFLKTKKSFSAWEDSACCSLELKCGCGVGLGGDGL